MIPLRKVFHGFSFSNDDFQNKPAVCLKKVTKALNTVYFPSDQMLSGKSFDLCSDKLGWHNLFYEQVTNRIDEPILKPLYTSARGSPNAPIGVLAAMMVSKGAQGPW